ncbi:TPA: hypothetical protein OCX93_002271 [Escherichia coli]|nr:hypothetical protein [Escherichia coli]
MVHKSWFTQYNAKARLFTAKTSKSTKFMALVVILLAYVYACARYVALEREMLLTNSAQHVTETECFISFPLTDIKIDA